MFVLSADQMNPQKETFHKILFITYCSVLIYIILLCTRFCPLAVTVLHVHVERAFEIRLHGCHQSTLQVRCLILLFSVPNAIAFEQSRAGKRNEKWHCGVMTMDKVSKFQSFNAIVHRGDNENWLKRMNLYWNSSVCPYTRTYIRDQLF